MHADVRERSISIGSRFSPGVQTPDEIDAFCLLLLNASHAVYAASIRLKQLHQQPLQQLPLQQPLQQQQQQQQQHWYEHWL
ncbi:hypothetical protein Emed_005996 [Eimeria media]